MTMVGLLLAYYPKRKTTLIMWGCCRKFGIKHWRRWKRREP